MDGKEIWYRLQRNYYEKDNNSQYLNHVYSLVMNSKTSEQGNSWWLWWEKDTEKWNYIYYFYEWMRPPPRIIWIFGRTRFYERYTGSPYRSPSILLENKFCLIIIDENDLLRLLARKKRTRYDNDDLWEPMHITIGLSMIFLKDQRAFVVAYRFDKWETSFSDLKCT